MLHQDLTARVLEAAFEVSNELGYGFLESVYERALQVALIRRNIEVRRQVAMTVMYKGVNVGIFLADMIVEEKVLIELKAVTRILGEHKAQVINYLKATGLDIGLLLNFGSPKVEYHRLYRPTE
jgi:GxxExxY protein